MNFSVENLGCRRGELRVLSGVGFSLVAGEALILRGPNGSGKTTLLRTLAGLTPPDAGSMNVPAENIAYAGHADGIKAQMSVKENLQFWAEVSGETNLDDALNMFGLNVLADRKAQNLSAGQKRRLGLSRMLVTGHKIWLFDEPTVSLDVESTGIFARMVEQHLANGGMAILATHIDMGLANARDLDVSQFKARPSDSNNPFLDEALI